LDKISILKHQCQTDNSKVQRDHKKYSAHMEGREAMLADERAQNLEKD
jgi:hypothetical protein